MYVSPRPPVPTAPPWHEGHLPACPCPCVRVSEAAPFCGPFSAQQELPRCYLGVLSVGRKHSHYRACSPHFAQVVPHHSVRGWGEMGQVARKVWAERESCYFQPCPPREPLGPRCPRVWVSPGSWLFPEGRARCKHHSWHSSSSLLSCRLLLHLQFWYNSGW